MIIPNGSSLQFPSLPNPTEFQLSEFGYSEVIGILVSVLGPHVVVLRTLVAPGMAPISLCWPLSLWCLLDQLPWAWPLNQSHACLCHSNTDVQALETWLMEKLHLLCEQTQEPGPSKVSSALLSGMLMRNWCWAEIRHQ